MNKSLKIGFTLTLALAAGLTLLGQQRQRVSPHESTTATIGGKKITITYGRPSKKGREIFGKLEPYGKVWRTGADEATTLETEADLMIGDLHVPAGTYALFTIPEQSKWTLVVNKTAKQWGAFKYEESQDLGRVPMTMKKLSSPLEQLTITLAPGSGNKGTLTVAWDTVSASVPVMVH